MTMSRSRLAALTGPAPKLVSPSRIARYYFHECERFLRYTSTPTSLRAVEGVPRAPHETSPVTRAVLDAGYAWEEQVIRDVLGSQVHIASAEPETSIRDRVFS